MAQIPVMTRRYVLAARPDTLTGPIGDNVLRYEDSVPLTPLGPGEVLIRVQQISVDPATRDCMNDTGSQIVTAPLGETMRAIGAGTVTVSRHPDFTEGDRVVGMLGWQEDAVVAGNTLRKIPDGVPISTSLHVLGVAGQTAFIGMNYIGRPWPGDTVIVTAAAGAVGSAAVQLAVVKGARVIGVAGGPYKCAWVRALGAEACIDYKNEDVEEAVSRLCPNDNIEVIFDNVGGQILNALLPRVAVNARIVLCGAISRYEGGRSLAPLHNWLYLLLNRVTMQGFVYTDYADRFDEIEAALLELYWRGELTYHETIGEGLTAAPEAMKLLFSGGNVGKVLVRID
jgi:NADPH-dependent curcumin reductase CurA